MMNRKIGLGLIIALIAMVPGSNSFGGPVAGNISTSTSINLSEIVDAGLAFTGTVALTLPEVAQGAPADSFNGATGIGGTATYTGQGGYTINVTCGSPIVMTGTNTAATFNITAAGCAADTTSTLVTSTTIPNSGTGTLYLVGTRAALGNTQAPDTYTGAETVSIAYQ